MRKVFTLGLFFCFNILFAQNSNGEGGINQKDANNLKQGHWIIFNQNGKYTGYSEGQKVEEGDYLNNKKVGVWTKYYPNGNVNHEITFTNNTPNGYAKFYYKDGTLQEEGMWQGSKWVGEYKYYHENGQVFYHWNYNSSGKRDGRQEYYHANGNLMFEGDWKSGNETGVIKEYYEDGSLKAERSFNNGKIEPTATKTFPIGMKYHPNAKKIEPKVTVIEKKAESEVTDAEVKNSEASELEVTSKSQPVVKQASENKDLGIIEDGQHTTYDSKGNKLKEGEFKSGRLLNGKEYQYSKDGKLIKTFIIKGGVKTEEAASN